MNRILGLIGAVSGFIAVAAGAFGAHGLKSRMSAEMLSVFEVGVRYQMYHALAILYAALMHSMWSSAYLSFGGWFFTIGTVLFSGSLYLLAISGASWLGAITPVGGVAFLAGWACIAWAAWISRKKA